MKRSVSDGSLNVVAIWFYEEKIQTPGLKLKALKSKNYLWMTLQSTQSGLDRSALTHEMQSSQWEESIYRSTKVAIKEPCSVHSVDHMSQGDYRNQ